MVVTIVTSPSDASLGDPRHGDSWESPPDADSILGGVSRCSSLPPRSSESAGPTPQHRCECRIETIHFDEKRRRQLRFRHGEASRRMTENGARDAPGKGARSRKGREVYRAVNGNSLTR